MNAKPIRAIVVVVFGGFVAGCGASLGAPATKTVTVTATAGSSATDTFASDASSTESSSTDAPAEVPEAKRGQGLAMTDFFKAPSEWREDRFDIASRKDVKGFGGQLSECYASSASVFELRLGNKFTTLDFKAGQANSSQTSHQLVVVEIVGNGRQIDIQRVPFNRARAFGQVSVKDVNALEIRMYLDDKIDSCGNASVDFVLSDVILG